MNTLHLPTLRQHKADLLAQRAQAHARMSGAIDTARAQNRDLSDAESRTFDAAHAEIRNIDAELEQVNTSIEEAEEAERRSRQVDANRRELGVTQRRTEGGQWTIGREPTTYRKNDPNSPSFIKDLLGVTLRGDQQALERLNANAREVRALNASTDSQGGFLVPPAWMIEDAILYARAARPLADRVRNDPLPKGTDQINIPRILTGTAVAEQTTQNTVVQSTDATFDSVAANVLTIAGQQVVSVQLVEQSPGNVDSLLLNDLAADYAAKLDLAMIQNNVAAKRGLLNVTGATAVTYSQASPTVATFVGIVADAIQRIYTARYLPPDTLLCHPRRWAWLMSKSDSQGRPILVPNDGNPTNAVGRFNGNAQGIAGTFLGLTVVLDPNIPTNTGAGSNQDPVFVFPSQDIVLMEGSPNLEALREPKADQLSVLLRFYRYAAWTAERYPAGIAVINGTGLVTPVYG